MAKPQKQVEFEKKVKEQGQNIGGYTSEGLMQPPSPEFVKIDQKLKRMLTEEFKKRGLTTDDEKKQKAEQKRRNKADLIGSLVNSFSDKDFIKGRTKAYNDVLEKLPENERKLWKQEHKRLTTQSEEGTKTGLIAFMNSVMLGAPAAISDDTEAQLEARKKIFPKQAETGDVAGDIVFSIALGAATLGAGTAASLGTGVTREFGKAVIKSATVGAAEGAALNAVTNTLALDNVKKKLRENEDPLVAMEQLADGVADDFKSGATYGALFGAGAGVLKGASRASRLKKMQKLEEQAKRFEPGLAPIPEEAKKVKNVLRFKGDAPDEFQKSFGIQPEEAVIKHNLTGKAEDIYAKTDLSNPNSYASQLAKEEADLLSGPMGKKVISKDDPRILAIKNKVQRRIKDARGQNKDSLQEGLDDVLEQLDRQETYTYAELDALLDSINEGRTFTRAGAERTKSSQKAFTDFGSGLKRIIQDEFPDLRRIKEGKRISAMANDAASKSYRVREGLQKSLTDEISLSGNKGNVFDRTKSWFADKLSSKEISPKLHKRYMDKYPQTKEALEQAIEEAKVVPVAEQVADPAAIGAAVGTARPEEQEMSDEEFNQLMQGDQEQSSEEMSDEEFDQLMQEGDESAMMQEPQGDQVAITGGPESGPRSISAQELEELIMMADQNALASRQMDEESMMRDQQAQMMKEQQMMGQMAEFDRMNEIASRQDEINGRMRRGGAISAIRRAEKNRSGRIA